MTDVVIRTRNSMDYDEVEEYLLARVHPGVLIDQAYGVEMDLCVVTCDEDDACCVEDMVEASQSPDLEVGKLDRVIDYIEIKKGNEVYKIHLLEKDDILDDLMETYPSVSTREFVEWFDQWKTGGLSFRQFFNGF